ncbi:MAG TPA: protein phosphatase 2C domain-containing protein [Anaerolineaceae bacterium]|nr:protein phosphatase 2C domain-containing protein [Anaerolineaceae bacterium]
MIRVDRAHLLISALSHPGMTGKNNEDRYAVSAYHISETNLTPSVFAVLSDGIGGHKAGEVAAELAVEVLSRRVAESDGSDPVGTLENAITEASDQIFEFASEDGALQGMGATCACAWIIGSRLYSSSIGDSRIYLIRGSQIQQLTTDHTWIQEALDKGVLKPEDTRGHPNAHVIRRFLGSPTPPEVDLRLRLRPEEDDLQAQANQGVMLQPGDRLVLCSDGLTDLVQDEEIFAALMARPREAAVHTLVDLANSRGGHDNITIIAMEVPQEEVVPAVAAPAAPARRASPFPWLAAGCVGILLLVVIAGVALFSLGFLNPGNLNLNSLFGGGSSPTAVATVELPPVLLTAIPGGSTTPHPGGTAASLPAPVFLPTATPTPPPPAVTLTPWPTNTLPPHP